MKDRLWFYTAFLRRDTKGWVAGSKFTGEGTPEQRAKNGFPEAGTQGYNRGYGNSGLLRLSHQITQNHRWRIGFERVNSTQPLSDVTRLQAPESSNRIPQPTGYHAQARWTSTMTSRLLVEAGFAQQYNKWRREQFEWNDRKGSFNESRHRRGDGSVLDHRQSAGNPADVQRVRFLRDRVAQHQGRDAEPMGRLHPIQRSHTETCAFITRSAAPRSAWLSCPRRLTASRPRSTTTRPLRPGYLDHQSVDVQPGGARRHLQERQPAAKFSGRHVGTRSRLPGAPGCKLENHRPAAWCRVRRLRQRKNGGKGVRTPVRQSGIDDARTGGEPDGELYLGRSAGGPHVGRY